MQNASIESGHLPETYLQAGPVLAGRLVFGDPVCIRAVTIAGLVKAIREQRREAGDRFERFEDYWEDEPRLESMSYDDLRQEYAYWCSVLGEDPEL